MRNKYSNGYESINVSVNDFDVNIGKLFWDAYKMTWYGLHDVKYDPSNPKVVEACFDVVHNRALPTPKESIKFQFKIENISRVCLAQITRGRVGWWYVVESQMPEYVQHGVTIPKNLYKSKYKDRIIKLINDSQDLYNDMSEDKIPPQDLRYMLIHGQQCSMVADVNYAALPGFFAMRAENGLTDELNLVARKMRKAIFDRIESNSKGLDKLLWYALIEKLDCIGAAQGKCLNYDKVFGNTGRFPSGNDKIPDSSNVDFDFKKSAWYLELQELEDNLLFKGEKEMINGWKNEC